MVALSDALPSAGRPSSSLHFVVGEMSGKLDQIMATILPQLADLKAADTALDVRVTSLERIYWGFVGVVSVGGVLFTVWQALPGILTFLRAS